jgi:hypothetical protein
LNHNLGEEILGTVNLHLQAKRACSQSTRPRPEVAEIGLKNQRPAGRLERSRTVAPDRLVRTPGRRVAGFLLAWHNAEENGGWDPTDLWNVDAAIADDMLTVVRLLRDSHRYPDGLGVWGRDPGRVALMERGPGFHGACAAGTTMKREIQSAE